MSEMVGEMTPTVDSEGKSTTPPCLRCAGDETKAHNHDVPPPAWITEKAGKFLKARRADVFIGKTKIVEVSCEQTALKALEMLLENNIMSAPVFYQKYTAVGDGADAAVVAPVGNPEYLGFVDCLDLAVLATRTGLSTAPTGGLMDKLARWFDPDTSGPVSHAINLSRNDRFWTCQPTTSLGKIVALMAERVHRVAVLDPETNMVVGIISQSGLLAKLAENMDMLGDQVTKPISEFLPRLKASAAAAGAGAGAGAASIPAVLSVKQGAPARAALELMAANNVSGVALVDDEGRLVTNMSASDVRMMARESVEKFDVLELPCLEFVSRMREAASKAAIHAHSNFVAGGERRVDRAITIAASDSLMTVMNLLVASRLHRVYVVDGEGFPTGIVTITDIMAIISGRTAL